MKENLTIKEITKRVSQSGKDYWIVKTDKGQYSVWDTNFAKEIESNIGKSVEAETDTKGKYKNITAVYGFKEASQIPTGGFEADKQERIEEAIKNKTKSIAVGYALQLTMAEMNVLLPKAKDLVEATVLMKNIEAGVVDKAKGLYEMIKTL